MWNVRVLVVEDDVRMAAAIRRGLRFEGLIVDLAAGGEEALRLARATSYDAIVLDVMMPGLDGFETCRRLRADGVWAPVVMLTARDGVEDRVRGLDGGADDYLTKPFSVIELVARLRALARRGPLERPAVLEVGDLRLDPATRRSWRGECEIALSAREFALLETFMRRPGHVLSQLQLLESAWDLGYQQRSNVVEVYVRYLREKIDRPFGVRSLETVRGVGYRLRNDDGEAVSRLPIRLRLTAAFAGAMVLVLAAAGLFVYLRLRADLDESVDAGLRSRAAAVVASGHASAGAAGDAEEGFAQLLGVDGRVLDMAGGARGSGLTAAELERASREAIELERRVRGIEGSARVLAGPAGGATWSWWASRSTIATRHSPALRHRLRSAGRSRWCSRHCSGTRSPRRG